MKDFGRELDDILEELGSANVIYHLSPFWQKLAAIHVQQLRENGFDNFKRTVSLKYFHFSLLGIIRHELHPVLWRWLRSPQLGVFRASFPSYLSGETGCRSFNACERLFYKSWIAMLRDYVSQDDSLDLLGSISEPDVGNPFKIYYRGQWISEDLCNSIHEFYRTGSAVAVDGRAFNVAELGAGYGRLAYVFLKALPAATYTIIDVPPALCIAQRYLEKLFPESKIFKYRRIDRFEDVKDEFNSSRIRILAANQIELLPQKQFNLFINISSLHEMTFAQMQNYILQIDRVCRGLFYTKQWRVSRAKENGFVIKETEYPIPLTWRCVFHRQHPLQRMFFEALYEINHSGYVTSNISKLKGNRRVRYEEMQHISSAILCRACNATISTMVWKDVCDYISGESFQIRKCENCSVRFTSPSPTQMDRFYPPFYRQYSALTQYILRVLYSKRALSWTKLLGASGVVLEIGLGPGWMLSALRRHGWRVVGTERTSKSLRPFSERSGLPVFVGGTDALKSKPTFDLVILFHVLEHLSDPLHIILQCEKLLKPGGKVIVSVPNFESWQSKATKKNWFHLDVPRHLFHFSPNSLSELLKRAGLEINQIRFVSFEHDPYGWVQSLLNIFGMKFNLLTRLLMGSDGRSMLSLSGFVIGFSAVILFIPSIFLSILSWIGGAGATVEIVAQKPLRVCQA